MSQCFVLDTPLEGRRRSNSGRWLRKKVLIKSCRPLAVRKRAISGIAGEMAIFQQLVGGCPHNRSFHIEGSGDLLHAAYDSVRSSRQCSTIGSAVPSDHLATGMRNTVSRS